MKRVSKSFSLIELLVVVAIIGILLSILLPSLRKAKEQAKLAVCGSAEQQMLTGVMTYVSSNNGNLPGVHTIGGYFGSPTMIWATRIKQYMADNYNLFNCPSQNPLAYWSEQLTGSQPAAFGYKDNEQPVLWNRRFGYGMNDWGTDGFDRGQQLGLGNHIGGPDDPGNLFFSEIEAPGDHIAIGDSTTNSSYDFVLDPTNSNEYPGNVHIGGAMIGHSDGHVRYYKQSKLIGLGEEMRKKWNSDNLPHN